MERVRVRTKDNWHVFGTIFSPTAIQRELSNLLGRDAVRPLEFDPAVNFDVGAGRVVKKMLLQIHGQVHGDTQGDSVNYAPALPTSDLQLRQLEKALVTLVLEGLHHNYSKFVNGPSRKIAPWQVRIVEEFIQQHAADPVSLGDLAVVAGVSGRSLQSTFLRHRGCSPMEFLRRTRFERVRDEILHPDHTTTVTSAAFRWGFLHLSRFAAEYRARYNESPSTTLRRTRGLDLNVAQEIR